VLDTLRWVAGNVTQILKELDTSNSEDTVLSADTGQMMVAMRPAPTPVAFGLYDGENADGSRPTTV
jgi:hypothetical protein